MLIGMIMLIMLTLIGIAAVKFGNLNSLVVSNTQQRMEATRAAEQAIEAVISSQAIAEKVPAGWTMTAGQYQITQNMDINGDGVTDYLVTVRRSPCITAEPIKTSALNLASENDLPCSLGAGQNFGVSGAASADSLCSDVVREAEATARDVLNQTESSVVLGFGVRVGTAGLGLACQ